MGSNHVIVVDLDGSLTKTDTLLESIILLVRNKPLSLFMLPIWLVSGRAYFKAKVAENTQLDVTKLPYDKNVLDWLESERVNGNRIVLCSAANEHIAQAVANHLKLFDDVLASNANTNLKSINKRKLLDEKFGIKGYDYAGNSKADIHVWAGSRRAIVINATNSVHSLASRVATVSQTFPASRITISEWIRTLRVHHWLKNLLVFTPLLAAHQLGSFQSLFTLVLAFFAFFNLCASSAYVMNDLLDLESDRLHPRKRNRSFCLRLTFNHDRRYACSGTIWGKCSFRTNG